MITCLSFSEKSKNVYLIQIEILYSLLVPLGKCASDFVLSIFFIPFAELQKQGLTYWKVEMLRKQEIQAQLV